MLAGPGHPDIAVIDVVARLELRARREGAVFELREVAPELAELLGLAGLRRQVVGEPEGGEQLVDVEEGVEPGDLAV